MSNTKIYVGNLPFSMTEQEVQAHFEQVGEVTSVKIINNKFNGKSKGFGFVEMTTEASAQDAVNRLNGTEIQGRPLTVNFARPMETKDNSEFNGERGPSRSSSYRNRRT